MAKAKAPRRGHPLAMVRSHWKLVWAAVIGLAVGFASNALHDLRWVTDAILAWDTTCAVYIGLLLWRLRGHSIDDIRKHAAAEDQGRATILVLVLVSTAASLLAVAAELGFAQHAEGPALASDVVLVVATVALSFFMMHMIFAVRYAHEYYDPSERQVGKDAEGLKFPGGEAPDYWDFLHFSLIIGVASQTADIAITDKGLRRLSTLHSLTAFAFNTVIVALTINLLASLFK
jgi:uncharacterized membrane protein